MFRIKFNDDVKEPEVALKDNAALFFDVIMKKHLLMNPVEI